MRGFGNTVIFGDSYSTFKGHIPDGYAFYYPPTLSERPQIDDVKNTWWYPLIEETNSKLVLNDSWSGSTIGYTGYGGADTSKTSSFIFRLNKYIENGFFEKKKIDTVFVFGATNDSWSGAPLGAPKYENVTESDRYCVLPAICDLLGTLKRVLPNARIVYIINSDLKDEITSTAIEASSHYGIEYVLLKNIDKKADHPTVLGMKQIKKQVLDIL